MFFCVAETDFYRGVARGFFGKMEAAGFVRERGVGRVFSVAGSG